MSDLLNDLYSTSQVLLPWMTFLIGLVGSIHCAGMCGGLVMACGSKVSNNISYQLGRLVSYSILAILSGVIGSYFSFTKSSPIYSIIPGVLIGIVFIWLGIKVFLVNSSRIKIPNIVSKMIYSSWSKVLPQKGEVVTRSTSFSIGAFSILLPCGLLYGVILALGSFNSPLWALLCIFTFWLGTLPMMGFAPNLIKIVLTPVAKRLPIITSLVLILLGIGTILHRIHMSYQTVSCH